MRDIRREFIVLAVMILAISCCASARTWYILPDSTGDAPTIQAGVDSASAGDTVLVACGTYHDCTHPDPYGYMNCAIVKSGICIRSETGQADCVTIDAERLGRAFYCGGVDSSSSIEGFTITGGMCSGGGGVFCLSASPRIANCHFLANYGMVGGGIYCERSSPTVVYCSFSNNDADGGGIALEFDSDATISNCSFTGNVGRWGGGILTYESSPVITECLFRNNDADWEEGGAMHCDEGAPLISGCVFSQNTADLAGGISFWHCSGTIVNCTFYDNAPMAFYCSHESAGTVIGSTFYRNRVWSGRAGGIESAWSSSLSVENTIVAFTSNGTGIGCWFSNPISLTCCDIYGNAGGDWVGCIADQYGINGNFSACPSFCGAPGGDFHLCDESPCLPGNHPDGANCGLIGALGEACICGPTRTEPTTWGAIKAMYR